MFGQSLIILARWLRESIAWIAPSNHHILHAATPTENPPLRNSTDTLWPSALVSENTSRECQGRKGEFADLGTPQAVSAPAASASGWRRAAAATTQAVGAREAVSDPGLPSGSLGRWSLMPWSPRGEAISPLHAGCCLHQGVPAPAVRARGEGGWLLLQTRLTKCWYYA